MLGRHLRLVRQRSHYGRIGVSPVSKEFASRGSPVMA